MIDWTKPVQTRDGKSVRVLCTNRRGGDPVIALITTSLYKEELRTYNEQGHFFINRESPNDLINVPQRHKHADIITAWANGAKIEWRASGEEDWRPFDDKSAVFWFFELEYRVKPD